MNIEVHWQDADSSSSNAVTEHFPKAKVMICGGHAGRAHKKQLEKLKSFSDDFKRKHQDEFPTVNAVVAQVSTGWVCITKAFVDRARNNFSESAEEFELKYCQNMHLINILGMEDNVTSRCM